MKKLLSLVIATVLMSLCFIGTTYAWLVAKSEPVITTFTAGNINIELTGHEVSVQKMVPGATLAYSSQVVVKANSEDCWLFIKEEKSSSFDTYLSYNLIDGWTQLDGQDGIYYRIVDASETDQIFGILANDEINVNRDATKEDYDALGTNYPTLTFTAYAVQKLGFDTAASAWEEARELG